MHFFECQCISTKVLIDHTRFLRLQLDTDSHLTWSSEPREGLAACSPNRVPSFITYFKTLSMGPVPGIEPATSRSAQRCTD